MNKERNIFLFEKSEMWESDIICQYHCFSNRAKSFYQKAYRTHAWYSEYSFLILMILNCFKWIRLEILKKLHDKSSFPSLLILKEMFCYWNSEIKFRNVITFKMSWNIKYQLMIRSRNFKLITVIASITDPRFRTLCLLQITKCVIKD